jgi:hypothetical protein
MTGRQQKLAVKLKDADLAEKLAEAGLDSPQKIRQASDKAVEAAVGKSGKGTVRKKYPRHG